MNIIQFSQGATRKALLSVIGNSRKNHTAKPHTLWAFFWLEGAQLAVEKRLSDHQVYTLERNSGNRYELLLGIDRSNVVQSPSMGPVEITEHAVQQFAIRAGFECSTGGRVPGIYPPQESIPSSTVLTLSRWLRKETLEQILLREDLLLRKKRRHMGIEAEYWGTRGEMFRFTTIMQDSGVRVLVTVYTRNRPLAGIPVKLFRRIDDGHQHLPIYGEMDSTIGPFAHPSIVMKTHENMVFIATEAHQEEGDLNSQSGLLEQNALLRSER